MPYDIRQAIGFDPQFRPRIVHADERARVVLACLDAGQQIPPHSEDKQGYFYVVEGSGTFLSQDGPVPVKAGELVTAQAGSVRGFRSEGEKLVVLIVAVLPAT